MMLRENRLLREERKIQIIFEIVYFLETLQCG